MIGGFGNGELFERSELKGVSGGKRGECGQCKEPLHSYVTVNWEKKRGRVRCGLLLEWVEGTGWVVRDHGVHLRCSSLMSPGEGGVTGLTRRCSKCRRGIYDDYGGAV